MIGDIDDIRQRLRLTLPTRWFADEAPVLDGLLAGLGSAWAALFSLLQLVRRQARIATATADFLDLAAIDLFGLRFQRRSGEQDEVFRPRLLRAMQRERSTRQSVVETASECNFSVTVFEAAQPRDTGVYNLGSTLAWNMSGGWGSLAMPFETLIVAHPLEGARPDELLPALAEVVPAGGAAWVKIDS